MNLSQFCNITLFSRPAARYTNKDRLLYSTTSSSGGRFAPRASAGFTLVEVLVAMVILLVGIWTLAVSFPKLLGVVATQEKRTEMARQADRTLDQLIRHPNDLPLATRGDSRLPDLSDPTLTPLEGIDATGSPEDPSITDFAITHPNARDDMIEVIGERFTVPAPLAFPYGPYPVYVFRQGLAEPGATVVYQVFEATTGDRKPWQAKISVDSGGTLSILQLPNNAYIGDPFALDPVTPWTAYVSYAWVYDGHNPATDPVHYVNGEEVIDTGQVVAGALGHNIVEGSLTGEVRAYYDLAMAGIVQHESGALLAFLANFTGARLGVNYTLRTDPDYRHGRRALIMSEEHRIVSSPQTVTLVASHIDETFLPVDLNADTLYNDTNILAVDLNTGYVYSEGSGLDWPAEDATSKGQITVGYSLPAPEIGHDLRFYYVTLDQDLISVQIAPATFVDVNIATLPDLYRSYKAVPNAVDAALTDLLFYPCNAGHTVSVDYKYRTGPNTTVTVYDELHTISTELYPPGDPDIPEPHYVTLNPNDPNVEEIDEIIAVTGKSLQAIAWWRTPNGRLERLEINTVR